MSIKAKRTLILGSCGLVLFMILVGIMAFLAGHDLLYWAENRFVEVNIEVLWAGIMLYVAGIIDILIGFWAIICGVLWFIMTRK